MVSARETVHGLPDLHGRKSSVPGAGSNQCANSIPTTRAASLMASASEVMRRTLGVRASSSQGKRYFARDRPRMARARSLASLGRSRVDGPARSTMPPYAAEVPLMRTLLPPSFADNASRMKYSAIFTNGRNSKARHEGFKAWPFLARRSRWCRRMDGERPLPARRSLGVPSQQYDRDAPLIWGPGPVCCSLGDQAETLADSLGVWRTSGPSSFAPRKGRSFGGLAECHHGDDVERWRFACDNSFKLFRPCLMRTTDFAWSSATS